MTRQMQLALVLLALLPVWYSLAPRSDERPQSLKDNPYYMLCLSCGLEYPCGPDGAAGMRCPRCRPDEGTMVLRTRSGRAIWDLLTKLFVGVTALMAVFVLVLGDRKAKKPTEEKPADEPAAADDSAQPSEIRNQVKEELKSWAQAFVENRGKRRGR